MRYTHVIFDLDGTLLDTLQDLACACNLVCARSGWPTFPVDAYRYKVGNGMPKLVERIIPAEFAGMPDVYERTLSAFQAAYAAHREDHTAPYPGIIDTLDELAAAGATLAVLSNKDHAAVVPLVERYFGKRFALVQGRVDAFPPKPAAPITRYVLDALGAPVVSTLYVGDSSVDVETGHNAGIDVAGVAWGFRGRAELERAGADHIAKEPAELLGIVWGTRDEPARLKP